VPAGAAVDPETPLAVIVSDLDFVPFFTKDVAPPLPETSATEPGPSISRTNSDQEPAAADMASSSSSSSSQGAASKADESSPEMPEHKQEEPKQKEAEAPSARSSASGGARGEDGEKNKASTTESEELNFKSTTSTSSPSSSEVEVARSHAQALAAAQSAAQVTVLRMCVCIPYSRASGVHVCCAMNDLFWCSTSRTKRVFFFLRSSHLRSYAPSLGFPFSCKLS